ncbi:LysR family transcriptional regulator [Parashewanella curva]|uniref:LysR family transcriptional regulator n=1 Tax=Parashewanella curva TaxID=2338552 RepID=A0A3L8PZY0_9GAMM|nr:LysR family transcriptional regulator [Parashewanella curva]RLV60098.1 LysR family transcriptional regulator [Parashewanella curva]
MANANELALFALLVNAKSFKKASELAGISPAAFSKKIAKLEQSLEVQLLYRTTRTLRLTEAGEILYQHAKGIDKQVSDALSAVSDFSGELTGTIKMTVPTISGELLLAETVMEFCQHHPNLNVDMRLENEFVDLIQEGQDLAIRTGELTDSSLIAKPIIQSNWIVCCAPSYKEQFGLPATPDELVEHNCLAYTYQSKGAREWRFTQNDQQICINIKGNFAANNAQALRKAAIAGHGIVYVPKCCVYEDLQSGALIELLPDFKARSLGVYAVYPFTKHQAPKVKMLIEFIAEAYKSKAEYF